MGGAGPKESRAASIGADRSVRVCQHEWHVYGHRSPFVAAPVPGHPFSNFCFARRVHRRRSAAGSHRSGNGLHPQCRGYHSLVANVAACLAGARGERRLPLPHRPSVRPRARKPEIHEAEDDLGRAFRKRYERLWYIMSSGEQQRGVGASCPRKEPRSPTVDRASPSHSLHDEAGPLWPALSGPR